MAQQTQMIELTIPSQIGYEKMAMKLAATVAQHMGFVPERVQDLKTAVSEACLNAIEHGNRMDEGARVLLRFDIGVDHLCIDVQDEGRGGPPPQSIPEPDIDRKIAGEQALRQMGLYVIRRLVDESGFVESAPGDGNRFRMVMRLNVD